MRADHFPFAHMLAPVPGWPSPSGLRYRRWAWPFEVFGVNALVLFVGSGLMVKLMGLVRMQGWIFRNLFLSWASPINASLFYAIAFILLWLLLMWLLYRKRIFIKV